MNDTDVLLRPVRESDLDGLAEVWKRFMDFHRDVNAKFQRCAEGHTGFRGYVAEKMHDEDFFVRVAVDGDRVVGYVLASVGRHPPIYEEQAYCNLMDAMVDEEYRRRGIGERMVRGVEEWARSRGLEQMQIFVVAQNRLGVSFWRRMGFEDHMLVMRRPVA